MVTVKRISKAHVAEWEAARTTAPAPFTTIPSTSPLLPLLTTLDPSKVYITHLDRHPIPLKSRIFTVPVVLNLTISALLLWRLLHIGPWYLALLAHVAGQRADLSIDVHSTPWSELVWLVATRGSTFMLDFVLARFVVGWPVSFFLERPGNPVLWRWNIGFRPIEIVVRVSRGWGAAELLGGARKGQESPFWKTRVLTGIDHALLREKTGYLLMGRDWDLDFRAMIDAHGMVRRGETGEEDWEKSVFVHKDGLGWCLWKAWEKEREVGEEEQRRKMMKLKERLTVMGKESLFWRWIEVVQYESSKGGVFDRKRQMETADIIKNEFEKAGVDFEALIKEIGGIEGTPGM